YLFDDQGSTKLVRKGESVPGGNGVFNRFLLHEIVALTNQDQIAFNADLINIMANRVDSGVDPSVGTGIFRAHATGGVTEYVRTTDPAPDGNGAFGLPGCCPDAPWREFSPPGLDDVGSVAFFGYLIGTAGGMGVDDSGIFHSDGASLTRLLRLGQPDPVDGDTVDFLPPKFGSHRVGQVGFIADVDVVSPDYERMYVAEGGIFDKVFVSGGAPPDGDGDIVGMTRVRIAANGNIVFVGFVNNTANPLDEGGTLFFFDGVMLQQIARVDQLAPFEIELLRFEYFPGLDSNNENEVAFSATLQHSTQPISTSVIYRWQGNGLSVAVHEGDPAPDGNGTFGDLAVPVFLNDSGQIAFEAEIEGSMLPPGLLSDVGLFVVDPDGTIQTVVRSGQMLAGKTVYFPRSLASTGLVDPDPIDPFGDADFPLRVGGIDMINNSGQVASSAILSEDGIVSEWGLFLWNGPVIYRTGMEDGTLAGWDSSFP
ncbi:MAG: hypothetical protein P8Y44_12605, partial [Acidobacteriota bacterium]